ncbi:MAG: TlpA family protein disulfide reductase [Acidobacteria bacterium]|nr:TlpA family protein disulfide reductase [Acidobacteriota bacterium]
MTTDRFLQMAMAAALAVLSVVLWDVTRDRTIQVGDRAPEFSIRADNGMRISLSSFGGKVLVLNFWATWCPPCVKETPALEQLHRELKDRGLVVMGISIDKKEEKYKSFLKRFGVTFLTARDESASISDSFGTYRVPETYVIKDGKVVQKIIGADWKEEEMIRFLKTLL